MIKVYYTLMIRNKRHIAVSDASYFEDNGPDWGDGPNYKEIKEAMIACGTSHINGCVFNLNGHSVSEIQRGMAEYGFNLDGDEDSDFDECMCECGLDYEEEDYDDEDCDGEDDDEEGNV